MGTLSSTLARRKVASVAAKEREPDAKTSLDIADNQHHVIRNAEHNTTTGVRKVSFMSEEGKSLFLFYILFDRDLKEWTRARASVFTSGPRVLKMLVSSMRMLMEAFYNKLYVTHVSVGSQEDFLRTSPVNKLCSHFSWLVTRKDHHSFYRDSKNILAIVAYLHVRHYHGSCECYHFVLRFNEGLPPILRRQSSGNTLFSLVVVLGRLSQEARLCLFP